MRRLALPLLLAALLLWPAGCGSPAVRRTVFVYATHTDEAYAGGGTVADVARELALSLRAAGFLDVRWLARSFLPYDAAYRRSRSQLRPYWRLRPLAIDVHRDAAPRGSYAGMVDGRPVARVLLVVGRANWRRRSARRTAERVVAAGRSLYPGWIKGIYIARAGYNQDLTPTPLLVEVGNVDTPLVDALRAARLLAAVLAVAFLPPGRRGPLLGGGAGDASRPGGRPEPSAAIRRGPAQPLAAADPAVGCADRGGAGLPRGWTGLRRDSPGAARAGQGRLGP